MSATQDEGPIHRAIRELGSAQVTQLNRLLACEALLYSLLERIDRRALAGLAEEYDAALLRLAEQLSPSIQRPELWQEFAKAIEDLQKRSPQQQPDQTPPGSASAG